ncbi:MAG: hypothetical protein IIA41_11145 [SAR324 cluster bacterium]|nr:hypothetical protein [SAR324 cluster bacterium]
MPPLLKRILSEPLHHFLLLGVGIFALYAWLGGGDAKAPERRIVVSAADAAQMAEFWAKRAHATFLLLGGLRAEVGETADVAASAGAVSSQGRDHV